MKINKLIYVMILLIGGVSQYGYGTTIHVANLSGGILNATFHCQGSSWTEGIIPSSIPHPYSFFVPCNYGPYSLIINGQTITTDYANGQLLTIDSACAIVIDYFNNVYSAYNACYSGSGRSGQGTIGTGGVTK